MRRVDQPVDDRVGRGRIDHDLMSRLDRELTGDDCRATLMAIVDDLQQISLLGRGQQRRPPVVEYQQVDRREALEECEGATVASGEFQVVEQPTQTLIEECMPFQKGRVRQSAGDEALADAGGSGDQHVLMPTEPLARGEREDQSLLQSATGAVVQFRQRGILPQGHRTETPLKTPRGRFVHHLIRVLASGGEGAAAELVGKLGAKSEVARELAYRLYTLCERKKRAAEVLACNGLVQRWPEIVRLAREGGKPNTERASLFGEPEE